jgi:hypothetical protein
MEIIEAAKNVVKENESLKTGALQFAIAQLKEAIEAHDAKIEANRAKKSKKEE